MDPKLVTSIVTAAVVAWVIYRRVRRTFGRQPVHPLRMRVRIGILAVVGVLMLSVAVHSPSLLAALVAGVACGAALGAVGLRHTQFDVSPAGQYYTPHTYMGVVVITLVLGRVAYRIFTVYQNAQAATAGQDPFAGLQRSPLTLAIVGLLVGYYGLYTAGVLKKIGELAAAASGRSGVQP